MMMMMMMFNLMSVCLTDTVSFEIASAVQALQANVTSRQVESQQKNTFMYHDESYSTVTVYTAAANRK